MIFLIIYLVSALISGIATIYLIKHTYEKAEYIHCFIPFIPIFNTFIALKVIWNTIKLIF